MARHPENDESNPAEDLETINGLLADWAARSAATSEALIDRFESMGYEVRGKSEDEIAEVLRRPPTGSRR